MLCDHCGENEAVKKQKGTPSTAEYWHIGATQTRLRIVVLRSWIGEKRCDIPAQRRAGARHSGPRPSPHPAPLAQRQSSDQASVSTERSICSISSNCCWSQINGGATWTTGSPRSSARQ